MRNITVSIDEYTHRQARIRAAELGTSVSALVRICLNRLVAQAVEELGGGEKSESPAERRLRLQKFFKEFDARGRGITEILPREAIYDRDALR